jgi:hypothetical protein
LSDLTAPRDRRTVTPAIVVSAVFVAACAVFAIAFVGARGGLQMPIAATDAPVAVASEEPIEPTEAPLVTEPPATPAPPTLPPTAAPTVAPPPPTVAPTVAPTPVPTFAIPTLEPGDPLLALEECDDRPGCFEYIVVRGDTLSGIISRYLLDIDVLEALNPGRLSDPSLVVVGQLLYLGRDPLARLEPCPNGEACALYVVQAGDSIAEIADRYLLTREQVLDANPGLPRPIQPGQVIKLPRVPNPG